MNFYRRNQPGKPQSPAHDPRPKQRFRPRASPRKEEQNIYFIALLPNAATGKEIIRIKQEFADNYDARQSLRVLPYITLQVPFTAKPEIENALCRELADFAAAQSPFDIHLKGFGAIHLKNRRVLYIHVEKDPALQELHTKLMGFLRKEFGFSSMLARYGYNPHISVAVDDLKNRELEAAWEEYHNKPFEATFRVNNLYIFRHTGTSWEVLQKCRLGSPK
ncbi:RNA 2',3'-cyclic phosphodiesterase [Chitinophaga oryziterrae]|uniref:RNA 2',3'-cyclic phosphodiesterase n=1 Tax=Chitinophaga oryziterrae TaxID=1031224 RepID=A0A6N8J3D1_9BACT|nr:2'-5' RNA ligase family protein [Chitinophaga oryziterrae]MVT39198.1 RNA 2',3'-cyclic phosphodiesterase [Chitinophaga oryziterrae]